MKMDNNFIYHAYISKRTVFALVVLLVLSVHAYGQDMLTATIANQQVHDFQRERIRSEYEQEKNRAVSNSHKTKPIVKSADPRTFLFIPNKQVSVRLKQSIINNIKKKNPNSTLGEALNDRNNPYPNYVKLLKSLGLDVEHNYADAFTAYMLGMWRIANKKSAPPSKQQIQYVRNQVLSVTDPSGWTDRKKQESTEYLIYDLIFANEPYESSRQTGNRRQLQVDSDIVQQRFLRENNMDLRNMDITENGLTRKK